MARWPRTDYGGRFDDGYVRLGFSRSWVRRLGVVLLIVCSVGALVVMGFVLATSAPSSSQAAAPTPSVESVGHHLSDDVQQLMDAVTPRPPDLNPSTTAQLQGMVNGIAAQAAEGDFSQSSSSLDALKNQVIADGAGQTISSDRVALVQTAVVQLQDQLAALSTSAPEPSATPAS